MPMIREGTHAYSLRCDRCQCSSPMVIVLPSSDTRDGVHAQLEAIGCARSRGFTVAVATPVDVGTGVRVGRCLCAACAANN